MNAASGTVYKIPQMPFGRMLYELTDDFFAIDGTFSPFRYWVRRRPACG